MFLGWHDGDRKRPSKAKVADAIERYMEKFGAQPQIVLTSPEDAAELEGKIDLPVRGVSFLKRHTYYVGVEEPTGTGQHAA